MNERIAELYNQAIVIKDGGDYVTGELDPKKFAELIVKECISIAQDRAAFDWAPPNDVNHIINEIKEHFGVEEQATEPSELHTCPYAEEIHGDYETLCDCDEEKQHQCRMDI